MNMKHPPRMVAEVDVETSILILILGRNAYE